MKDSMEDCFEFAKSLVQAAGDLMLEYVEGCKNFEEKSSDIDLVTEVDKNVEETLVEGLSKRFPSHKFIGEESVAGGAKCELTEAATWIIDPVDGTMNFVHGFPHSCISVALVVNYSPVIGIIYNPMLQQLFTAIKGGGAFLNGRKIHVSEVTEMSKALIVFEAGTNRDVEKCEKMFEHFKRMVNKCHGVRSLGSAALNMAMVAMGGADANFEFGIHAWDIAAGAILVTEAGGVCHDPSGTGLDLLARRVLCASSAELAQEVSESLILYPPERD